MYLSAIAGGGPSGISWPTVVLVLGLTMLAIGLLFGLLSSRNDSRRLQIDEAQAESLRQLVDRYEQLAEKTMDAQQRIAADVSELRTRTSAIEQILRTVE